MADDNILPDLHYYDTFDENFTKYKTKSELTLILHHLQVNEGH